MKHGSRMGKGISRRDLLSAAGATLTGGAALSALRPLLGAVPAQAAEPIYGGTLTIAFVPFATHIDANSANISTLNEVAKYFYETLFDWDADGKLVPSLVQSEQISRDGLTVTWKLQPGVKFHDGTSFNAAAVKWNLERKGEKKQPLYDALFVRRIDAVDDLTVRVTMTQPQPGLAAWLSLPTFSMYSPSFVQKVGDDGLKRQASGTGPFTVQEFRANEILRLRRAPQYWRKGLPYLDEIVFRMVPSISARAAMLQAGDVDMALALSIPDIARLRHLKGFRVLQQLGSQQYYLAINAAHDPLKDGRVRRALNHAVDKDGIMRTVLLGSAEFSTANFLTRKVDGYARAGVYPYDRAAAARLLDEAGWKPGPGGMRAKDGKSLSLDIATTSGARSGDVQIAELVQGMLKNVGVGANVNVVDSATFLARVNLPIPQQLPYDLLNLAVNVFSGDAEYVMRTFYLTSAWPPAYYNYAHYSNPTVDKDVDAALRAPTKAQRDQIFARIIKQVYADTPTILLCDVPTIAAVQDTVQGVFFNGPANNWPAKYAWKEKR
ncbi:MAG TPA: ABC transporter substrate-binding protein [bacterium]|nr:ABC transporter substrate-binding protein [bacterium]